MVSVGVLDKVEEGEDEGDFIVPLSLRIAYDSFLEERVDGVLSSSLLFVVVVVAAAAVVAVVAVGVGVVLVPALLLSVGDDDDDDDDDDDSTTLPVLVTMTKVCDDGTDVSIAVVAMLSWRCRSMMDMYRYALFLLSPIPTGRSNDRMTSVLLSGKIDSFLLDKG